MDRTERFYKIDRLLAQGRSVPLKALIEALEVSRATVKRDIQYMHDRFHAPIDWDRASGGYVYRAGSESDSRYMLPGLWFNATEAHALLTMLHVLSGIEPGILAENIAPLKTRFGAIIEKGGHCVGEVARRVRVLPMAARSIVPGNFEIMASATLTRRRLLIRHVSRQTGARTEREVSPQRLIHYRDNWYLDTFCHLRGKVRSFSADSVTDAIILKKKAKDISDCALDEVLGSGYGIFGGRRVSWARLRFTSQHARWVANERWHPRQKGRYEQDGSYILEIPYADDRELLTDILKHGDGVEVLSPKSLRDSAMRALERAAKKYRG